MHLKGERQHASMLESLIQVLRRHPGAIPKMFVFDVKEDTAVTFKKVMPELALAPSVGHEYDIQRYNACVNHTLWSLETR